MGEAFGPAVIVDVRGNVIRGFFRFRLGIAHRDGDPSELHHLNVIEGIAQDQGVFRFVAIVFQDGEDALGLIGIFGHDVDRVFVPTGQFTIL